MKHLSKRRLFAVRKFQEEKARRRASSESPVKAPSTQPLVSRLSENLDQLIIVASLGIPAFKPGLVDRFLVLAGLHQLQPVLVINKIDLAPSRQVVEKHLRLYRGLGVDSIACSTYTDEGVEFLRERLLGLRSALVGHSGVGKSSLLKAIDPSLDVRTAEVSEAIGKGQHTTTTVRWFPLDCGGRIFDLPGLKLLPLELPSAELQEHFPEILQASRRCRFADCLHRSEPDCEVKRAVELEWIAESRFRSYLKLLEEALP